MNRNPRYAAGMLAFFALILAIEAEASAKSLPPVETYEFLTDKDDHCIKRNDSECDRMSEPRLFRGTWLVEFETSYFTPSGRPECYGPESNSPCIWLDGDDLPWPGRYACSRWFEVEFVGRRTLYRGGYGHLGGSEHKIIVDRMISARRILPDPYDANCDPVANVDG